HFVIFIHSLIMLLCVYDALCYISFFFNDPAPSGIYPLSLHDALPISIECIAGGILARLGKVSRDQPALVGGQMEPLPGTGRDSRSEEHTSELQSRENLVCRLLLEKKKKQL